MSSAEILGFPPRRDASSSGASSTDTARGFLETGEIPVEEKERILARLLMREHILGMLEGRHLAAKDAADLVMMAHVPIDDEERDDLAEAILRLSS